jgi:hypothetical protein
MKERLEKKLGKSTVVSLATRSSPDRARTYLVLELISSEFGQSLPPHILIGCSFLH